jgi:ligand-binding SRPBCC domain-containing protein
VIIKKYKSKIYSLETKQIIDRPIEEIWSFFTNPKNLNQLTPSDMNFKILSGSSDDFYEGKIISYSINPFKFYNIKWVTEITTIKKNDFFIDEQRFGPYKMWHHEHHFIKNNDNTTTIYDKVIYKLPYGIIGKLSHKLFIKKRLLEIFNFRKKTIKKLYTN